VLLAEGHLVQGARRHRGERVREGVESADVGVESLQPQFDCAARAGGALSQPFNTES
jgi:hypothetical protein